MPRRRNIGVRTLTARLDPAAPSGTRLTKERFARRLAENGFEGTTEEHHP